MSKREQFFEESISSTIERINSLLILKGKEYRRNYNPFHNFERGSEISGNSPSEVLQGFLLKHLISVEDIRNDLKAGKLPKAEKVNEKYDDIIVYFLIEKAMILENCKK